MDGEEEPIHTAARISAAVEHPFALDIIVSKPSALEASFKRHGNFATEIMTRGVILYKV